MIKLQKEQGASNVKKRESNIEILRIISMMFVVILHIMGHGGVINSLEEGSIKYFFVWGIEAFAYKAVNLFVIISGYFLCMSKMRPSKIFSLIMQTLFFSVICYLISLALGSAFSIAMLLKYLTPITSSVYWYCSVYFILLLISPILNSAIDQWTKKQHGFAALFAMSVFGSWTTIAFWHGTHIGNNGYDITWFVSLYIVAAYLRKYGLPWKKHYFLVSLICDMLLIASRVVIYFASSMIFGTERFSGLLYHYTSPLVIVSAVCFFMGMRELKINDKFSSVICAISKLSFGVYLFHEFPEMRDLIWKTVNAPAMLERGIVPFMGYIVVILLSLFAIGCFLEWIRRTLYKACGLQKAEKKLDALLNRFLTSNAGSDQK